VVSRAIAPDYNPRVAAERDVVCEFCRGTGWVIESRGRREIAVRCRCRVARHAEVRVAASRIPPRYAACTLDTFELWEPGNPTLSEALRKTRSFVASFPEVRRGLLFMGPVGIGKTHLAVAALRDLVGRHGLNGLYVNFLELVQELQMSFDGPRSREEIMSPVIDADLVVLDELGAGKLTPWVMDLLYHVVNSRYMQLRLTLFTTNFSDHPKRQGEESLTDRVGAPVRSRLAEMCEPIDMRQGEYGGDYRRFRKLDEWRKP
jgi:DNA replication protein DnaC